MVLFVCLWCFTPLSTIFQTTDTKMSASYFKIHLDINNGERIKAKLDDKRMDCPLVIAPSAFFFNN
jgi:hypothetical protein